MIDAPYHGSYGVLSTYMVRGKVDLVIDPGPASSVQGVLDALEEMDVDALRYVALTHIHLDHAAGTWRVLEDHPEAEAHVHPRGSVHLEDPSRIVEAARQVFGEQIRVYGEIRGVPWDKIVESEDGEVIKLDGSKLEVIWTPGHSTHSQSYFEPSLGIMFVGDAGGHLPRGLRATLPASPPPFNPEDALQSLDRLISFEPEIVCHSHFGYTERGGDRLRDVRDRIRLWFKVAMEGVKEGLNLRGIYERLMLEDPGLSLSGGEEARRAVYQSLTGFVEYCKWVRRNS